MRILLADNFDSFTRNLEHLLATALGPVWNVAIEVRSYPEAVRAQPEEYDLLVISPGPGSPSDYSGYARLLDACRPILGVCLGLQIINEHFGGATSRLPEEPGCVHGAADAIAFNGRSLKVARYHSLYLSQVAPCLKVTAANADGLPMAVEHKTLPIMGYQFHPESFLTDDGALFIRHAAHRLLPA